jgi:LacI family transcriptional regulator
VPDIGNSFFADLAKGVEQASIERNFNVLRCNTSWNLEREVFYLETVKSRAVDGVVYAAGAAAPTSQLVKLLAGVSMFPTCTSTSLKRRAGASTEDGRDGRYERG